MLDQDLEKKLLIELRAIIDVVSSFQEEKPAIKTENYHLYSVADAHKYGAKQTLLDFIRKNKLKLKEANQVLEVKIPLTFADYSQRMELLLSEIGESSDFKIPPPRKRDKLFSLLRGKVLMGIAYGKDTAVAFYRKIFRDDYNYLQIIHKENLKDGTDKIYHGLEKLLLS